MGDLVDEIRRRARRARGVERFVRLIVAGGLALVAGLWVGTLSARWSVPWLAGAALVVLGASALAAGIWSQIDA